MIPCTSCSNTIHYRQWFECGSTNTTALRCMKWAGNDNIAEQDISKLQFCHMTVNAEMERRLLHSSPQTLVSLRKHCSLVWHVCVLLTCLCFCWHIAPTTSMGSTWYCWQLKTLLQCTECNFAISKSIWLKWNGSLHKFLGYCIPECLYASATY